jgi:GT2 family glycosyltransferase
MLPPAAIIVPTRGRPHYLDRALASMAAQARSANVEIIVVDDGPHLSTRTVAESHGARYIAEGAGDGVNAARNRGIAATDAALLIFTDDDVEVHDRWLAALLEGARVNADSFDVFTGPIKAKIEDHRIHVCGREGWPITTTELGPNDRECEHGWSANLAIRRSAFDAVGNFDPTLPSGGDEQEWEDRYRASGGRVFYLAGAAVDHLRCGDDSRLKNLAAAARVRGRSARRYDESRGVAPGLGRELRVLAGCVWHGPRRLCMMGPVTAAHSIGRIEATISRKPLSNAPAIASVNDFLSLNSGEVSGRRAQLMALADKGLDLQATKLRRSLRRSATAAPRRKVLVLTIVSNSSPSLVDEQRAELGRSKHQVDLRVAAAGSEGKFANLNALCSNQPIGDFDWVVVLDDDVKLPTGFLDSFLHACEQAGFQIAQPAHRLSSHAAWPITRRQRGVRSRRTTFVEIGPVTAFSPEAANELIPFPDLQMGWGLDAHWAAIAAKRGWPIGIVDATPIDHSLRQVASDYPRAEAIAEAQQFLADKPYVSRDQVRTIGIQR